jgi:hypothetical protein
VIRWTSGGYASAHGLQLVVTEYADSDGRRRWRWEAFDSGGLVASKSGVESEAAAQREAEASALASVTRRRTARWY